MKPSVAAGVVAALALLTVLAIHHAAVRSDSVFLEQPEHGRWIRDGDAFFLKALQSPSSSAYRIRFAVSRIHATAPLLVRTTGRTTVLLDGRQVAELPAPADWNEPRTVELAPELSIGEHELEVRIEQLGPSVIAASSEPLGVETGAHWLAKGREGVWRPAALAERPVPSLLATEMTAFEAPARSWLAAWTAFSLIVAALLWWRHSAGRATASQFRALLIAIWSIVALNDFEKLPAAMGMDYTGHLAYVKFILDQRALPLATDGWEMFQAPLYYLTCAGMASLFGEWSGPVVRLFRLISIASALGQIEIAYRLSRRVFPEREDLQKVAILVSGLLPMGFAVSQGIGNEPLHGVLAALTLLCAARFVQREGPTSLRDAILLGVIWGLALLAKVTAALLAAPLLYALWFRIRRHPAGWRRDLLGASLAGVTSAAVAGWYYARNWLALGTPFGLGTSFAGGSLPAEGFWWQEPGYRMAAHLTRFGAALFRPFNAAIHGFWDNYYSTLWADGNLGSMVQFDAIPPWNYAPMLASTWVAILPSALMALGLLGAMVAGRERGSELAQMGVIALAAQMAAALVLYVQVPVYSQGKASYMLGLTPVFGLLAASGYRRLERSDLARIGAIAGLGGWAALVLCSYFVI